MAIDTSPAVPTEADLRTVRDLRGFWRRFGAVVAPMPVLALTASLLIAPSSVDASFAEATAASAAEPGAAAVALWLSLLFALLIVPGVMAVAWVARRGAPWLALAGGVVSLAAFAAGSALPNVDLAAYVAGQRGLDAAGLNNAVVGHPTVTGWLGFYLVAQAVGLVLLGLALWRSRAVPGWAAACLAVSGPAHLVGGVGGNALAAATWALTAVGFVGASVALLRQSNNAFDLPPGASAKGRAEAAGDARTVWRALLAVTAPLAAAGVTVGRYLLPYDTGDPAEAIFDKLVAATTFQAWVIWIGGLLSLVVCAGVVAVAWLSRRRAPVLTTVAVLLALPGYLALTAGGPYGDLLTHAVGTDPTLDRGTALALGTGMASSAWTSTLGLIFIGGHLLGTVVLGLAALRARALPRWVAIGLAVSQPIHLASVLTGIRELDLVGWGLTTLGFAVAGWLLLRMPNDAFDLAPLARR